MSEGGGNFEDRLREIAREVSRSVGRMAEFDISEVAEAIGVDPERARELADSAARWLADRAEDIGDEAPNWGAFLGHLRPEASSPPASPSPGPGPHPLDLPTEEQGRALSALDSGRWSVEPGSNVLVGHGDGPGPRPELGIVGELRARDWLAADGQVTMVGRRALARWIDSKGSPTDQPPSDQPTTDASS